MAHSRKRVSANYFSCEWKDRGSMINFSNLPHYTGLGKFPMNFGSTAIKLIPIAMTAPKMLE